MPPEVAGIPSATQALPAAPAATLLAAQAGGVGGNTVNAVAPVGQSRAPADALQSAARQVVSSLPGRNQFSFAFDRSTGMTIVKVYNADTGELVRQIPTEEIVRIAQLMRQEEAHPNVVDVTA